MSISRKNWSALSSLTRQWTVEDEEEVERERRRRNRSYSNVTDPDDDSAEDSAPSAEGSTQDCPEAADQAQVDFMEMLRVRDERRRKRQEEVLRQQRLQEAGQDEVSQAGPKGPRVGGERSERGRSQETAPVGVSTNNTLKNQLQGGNRKLDLEPGTSKESSRKFVSSLSISFDKGPTSPSGGSSLSSPMSPTGSFRAVSPDQPSATDRQNGDAQECENDSPSKGVYSPREREQNPFRRQNYRAWSFRMMRNKEEKSLPLQRSASFRISSNNTEADKVADVEEDKQSPFLRNSRQRISSRSIQETMEKLALAAQKSENIKSPTATPRSLYSSDEVSRKREIFEKEQQERAEPERGTQANRSDHQVCFQRGSAFNSEQASWWMSHTQKAGSGPGNYHPFNLTVASKRQLWQKREEEASTHNSKARDMRGPQF